MLVAWATWMQPPSQQPRKRCPKAATRSGICGAAAEPVNAFWQLLLLRQLAPWVIGLHPAAARCKQPVMPEAERMQGRRAVSSGAFLWPEHVVAAEPCAAKE